MLKPTPQSTVKRNRTLQVALKKCENMADGDSRPPRIVEDSPKLLCDTCHTIKRHRNQEKLVRGSSPPANELPPRPKIASTTDVVVRDSSPARGPTSRPKIASTTDAVVRDSSPAKGPTSRPKIASTTDSVVRDSSPARGPTPQPKIAPPRKIDLFLENGDGKPSRFLGWTGEVSHSKPKETSKETSKDVLATKPGEKNDSGESPPRTNLLPRSDENGFPKTIHRSKSAKTLREPQRPARPARVPARADCRQRVITTNDIGALVAVPMGSSPIRSASARRTRHADDEPFFEAK